MFLLGFSPILMWLGSMIVDASTSDLLIDGRPFADLWLAPVILAVLAWGFIHHDRFTTWASRLAAAGAFLVAAASLAYVVAALSARSSLSAGDVQRAVVADRETHGRGFTRRTTTTFALQDGSSVTTGDYSGRGRVCLEVRRVTGSNGFAWLQIVDSSPAPGPGQLEWPISRSDCFSGAPLASLGR
jgi:hypothetical protein